MRIESSHGLSRPSVLHYKKMMMILSILEALVVDPLQYLYLQTMEHFIQE